MPLLVDGYNLMHAVQASRWADVGLGRAALCRLLGEWAEASGNPVTVIFDGATPAEPLAGQLADPRIDVLYSGERTADDALADWIDSYSAARKLWVISSDRAVRQATGRRGAQSIKSEEFAEWLGRQIRRIREGGPAEREPEKPGVVGGEASDAWMRQFGFDPDGEEPFEHP